MGHSTDGHAVNFFPTQAALRVIHHVIYGGQIFGTAVIMITDEDAHLTSLASATTKYHEVAGYV